MTTPCEPYLIRLCFMTHQQDFCHRWQCSQQPAKVPEKAAAKAPGHTAPCSGVRLREPPAGVVCETLIKEMCDTAERVVSGGEGAGGGGSARVDEPGTRKLKQCGALWDKWVSKGISLRGG